MALDALTRYPDRGVDDRAALDLLLDEEWTCTVSTVVDGAPWAVPMLFVRDGDRVLLHGSTGAGLLRHVGGGPVADGAGTDSPVADGGLGPEVVLTVMQLRSLVLARTAFDHSADYVSATLRGRLERLEGEDKRAAVDAFTDGLVPGRAGEVPRPTDKELAATVVLALPIVDGGWILKARTHGFAEASGPRSPDDSTWAGVVPVRRAFGQPEPAPGNAPGVERPASVERLVERG